MTDQMTQTTTEGRLLGSAEAPVVVVDRVLDATPAEVWRAWTRPEQLRRWLGAVSDSLDHPGPPVDVAMTAEDLPEDPSAAQSPARFTVRQADPPAGSEPGRLVFVFDDHADPGGLVSLTLTEVAGGRCRLALRHALLPRAEAVDNAPGFGAGWESFLDWLEDVLAGGPHRDDDSFGARRPVWEPLGARLRRTTQGRVVDGTVVHERLVEAPADAVWSLLTTPDGLSAWLGRPDTALGAGVSVHVVHDGDDPAASTQTSVVDVWEPPYRLGMTWGFPGEAPSYLLLTLAPADGGTTLRLEHSGLLSAEDGQETGQGSIEDYRTGWHAHLDLLVAQAEGYGVPTFADAMAAARRAPA